MDIGPTGNFPHGKISPDDEGELKIAISDPDERGVIHFHFGKEVAWFALYKDDVRQLIEMLQTKVRKPNKVPF